MGSPNTSQLRSVHRPTGSTKARVNTIAAEYLRRQNQYGTNAPGKSRLLPRISVANPSNSPAQTMRAYRNSASATLSSSNTQITHASKNVSGVIHVEMPRAGGNRSHNMA